MHIDIDTDRCIGSGQCVLAAPDVFTQGGDGMGVHRSDGRAEAYLEEVRTAALACPVTAITLRNDRTVPSLSSCRPQEDGDGVKACQADGDSRVALGGGTAP